MRRLTILIAVVLFLLCSGYVMGGTDGKKGASDKAYEHASEKSVFNRVGDWFSTVGKSDEEKQKIIQERDEKRAEKAAQKEAEKSKKEALKKEKDLEKANTDSDESQKVDAKIKSAEKKVEKAQKKTKKHKDME